MSCIIILCMLDQFGVKGDEIYFLIVLFFVKGIVQSE